MSLVPSNIGSALTDWGKGISDVFQNVNDTVQTVNSVYDQLSGKSQSAPVQTVAPQGTVAVQPAALTTGQTPAMPNTTMLAVGAVVLIGVLLILK